MAAMNVKGDLLVIERQFSESEIRFACRSKDVGYLGTGSFGETWRVRANRGNEAWKILHQDGYDSERLAREVEGLRRAQSERVVNYLRTEVAKIRGKDVPALIFEYVKGGDLASLTAGEPINSARSVGS